MSIYAVAHIVHLYCAIAFVGGVFFEVLVLSVLHTGRVSCEARREVEKAMSYRAVRVMPFVVGLLFASGVVMAANRYLSILGKPLSFYIGRTVCHFLRYDADAENPVGVQRVGALRHRRRQNGAFHTDRRLVEIHTRRRLYPYAADCLFGKSDVLYQLVTQLHFKSGD